MQIVIEWKCPTCKDEDVPDFNTNEFKLTDRNYCDYGNPGYTTVVHCTVCDQIVVIEFELVIIPTAVRTVGE